MTNEQIISRCRHCGGTRKEHATRKPYRCPTRLATSYWEPWTLEAYREAEEAGRIAAAARVEPQEPATPHTAAQEAQEAQEATRYVDCTPNFGRLFEQFARDARYAGGSLSASLCAAQFDEYPEDARGLERRAKVLRVVQGYLAPLTIALQAATTVQAIGELREIASEVLATVDRWAGEFENQAEDAFEKEAK
jgi:hypothetical protein